MSSTKNTKIKPVIAKLQTSLAQLSEHRNIIKGDFNEFDKGMTDLLAKAEDTLAKSTDQDVEMVLGRLRKKQASGELEYLTQLQSNIEKSATVKRALAKVQQSAI